MKILFGIFLCVAIAIASPIDLLENENGQEYVLVPVHRNKRQVQWGLNQGGYGLGAKGTVFDNGKNRLDGTVGASKAWGSHGLKPDSYNGRLDFVNQPTRSTAFLGADRTPGYGTDVNAGVKYNFAQGKNWNADVTGQYGRHFGGPGGTGKPDAGVFLNVKGTF